MSAGSAKVSPRDASRQLLRDADEAVEARRDQDPAVLAALALPEVREALHLLFHGLAEGRAVRVEVEDATDYSPQKAADALGVSRKLVNKLIATGELQAFTLPGSTHKKIPASEVARLRAEHAAMRADVEKIVDDLVDAGAEY
jgi:excisionase family DNA binding protein